MRDKFILQQRCLELVQKLRSDPDPVMERGREIVSLRSREGISPFYTDQWETLMDLGVDSVIDGLLDSDDGLTSSNPFVGV